MHGNVIYVLEYRDNGKIWAVSLPPRSEDTAVLGEDALPEDFAIAPNYPNPFNAATTLSYWLPVAGTVTLKVYDAQGQLVRTLVEAYQPGGFYRVPWNGKDDRGIRVGCQDCLG